MKKKFSKFWVKSKQRRKQRKYRYNAPLHLKGKFLSAHLSTELREEYKKRSIRVVNGDKVRVMVGGFRKKEGKVERVNTKNSKVYITGIDLIKKDGSKTSIPISVSNIIITELKLDDKKRKKRLEVLKDGKKSLEKNK